MNNNWYEMNNPRKRNRPPAEELKRLEPICRDIISGKQNGRTVLEKWFRKNFTSDKLKNKWLNHGAKKYLSWPVKLRFQVRPILMVV